MEVLVSGEVFTEVDFDLIDKERAFNYVLSRFGEVSLNPFTVFLAGCYLLDKDFELLDVDFEDTEDKIDLKIFEYILKDGDVLSYDPETRARAFFGEKEK